MEPCAGDKSRIAASFQDLVCDGNGPKCNRAILFRALVAKLATESAAWSKRCHWTNDSRLNSRLNARAATSDAWVDKTCRG